MDQSTRRQFLRKGVMLSAAFATPLTYGQKIFGQNRFSRPKIAAIGVGGSRGRYSQGGVVARRAAEFGEMVAVCDVDDLHTAEFNKDFNGKLGMYRDYRKMLEKEKPDVVTIGTPDHWHVPIALAALHSGCDVYCEKPLTLTINEGIRVRDAVEETGRVFQVGTQQRSEFNLLFLQAVAIVRSGRLGENVNAYIAINESPEGGPYETQAAPEDLDWNMWVGPAPQVEYCEERRKEFRWYYEYSGGKMTDWGAHHIDIAQWALGVDHTGPTSIVAKGEFPNIVPKDFNWDQFLNGKGTLPNAFNTAMKFNVDLHFANGSNINVTDCYEGTNGRRFSNGILFEGSHGRIFVNRGRLTGKPVEDISRDQRAELYQSLVPLYKGRWPGDHMRNFFECIADRGEPISDVATHHRTMTSCHLCNIGIMLGRELKWNPDSEKFVNDSQADALISRASRPGFTL